MKILTLHQPWASLVAAGAKCIETRSWPTYYRGPLAIHAAKSPNGVEVGRVVSDVLASALDAAGVVLDPKRIPFGAVVALATLVDVQPITEANTPSGPERSFGNYAPGRFAWYLSDVRPLTWPIPESGGRRLQTWNIAEGMAQAAHVVTELNDYGAIMDQAHRLLTLEQYSAFFTRFLELRDGVVE